jgi:hypothetical protein
MKQHFFIKPGPGMKSTNKSKAGPRNLQQERHSGNGTNQQKNTGPSNEHIKRITKQRMNTVQKLPHGPLMVAAGNIDKPLGDFNFRKN